MKSLVILALLCPLLACGYDELLWPYQPEPVTMRRESTNWTFTVTNLQPGRAYQLWRHPVESTNWFVVGHYFPPQAEPLHTFTNRHEPNAPGYLFRASSLELLSR